MTAHFPLRPALFVLFVPLFALLAAWSPAQALTQIATVVAVRGEVQALDPAGSARRLALKAAIYEQDTLQTGDRGQVQILFTDNSLINLGRQSEMKIAEYRWQADQKDGALKTRIKEGSFRVMGGALATAAPQNFTTETATATIGIRGSMYAGITTAETLAVVFQGGKGIEITNALGTVAIDRPGFGTRVALDSAPLPPVKFTEQDLRQINTPMESTGTGEGTDEGQEEAPAERPADQGAEQEAAPDSSLSPTAETSGPEDQEQQAPLLATAAALPELSSSLLSTLQSEVVSVNSQTGLTATVTTTARQATTTLSGHYRNFLMIDIPGMTMPAGPLPNFLQWDAGTVNASLSEAGVLHGSLTSDGASPARVPGYSSTFGPYALTGYDPAATSYRGFAGFPATLGYTNPDLGPLQLTVMNYGEPSGQFFYNTFDATLAAAPYDLVLASVLYAGQPAATAPSNRIDEFRGHLIHTAPGQYDAGLEAMEIEVNYYNNRLIGRSFDPNKANQDNAIFFGTVNSDGSADLTLLTGGTPEANLFRDVSSAYGHGAARLFGDFHQGLAFSAAGDTFSLLSNSALGTWAATGAALRLPDEEIISSYPTSDLYLQGFVVGVADDTSTGASSRIWMNSAADDFTMTVDPARGVLSGTISAADLISGGAVQLSNLVVGGNAGNSAYVLNDQMVASLAGSNLTLRDHGNFLATSGPDETLEITNAENEYLSWGTWELAYTDPADASRDHLFAAQSFWLAGQQTDPTYLSTNLLNQPISGTYDGKAFGVQVDPRGQNASRLTNGATHLLIDFSTPAAKAVTGTIRFDQAVLTVDSAANPLTADGFTANIVSVSGATPSTSAVSGAFYGPSAQTMGGSFRAQMPNGSGYFGIFGGSR